MNRRMLVCGVAALTLAVAGCGKAEEQSAGADGGLAPGVTEDTITLGALVDLTAVFAPNSKAIMQGANLYWDKVNSDGGVCERQIELDVQDHAYDPQKAVSLYRSMSSNVLMISPVLGSSVMTALLPQFEQDNMTVGMAAWTSEVLPNEHIQITGSTYDVEMINAIDYLMREHGLAKGDAIGHIFFEGDFGGNAVEGAEFAAEELGLKLVKQQIKPTDTDLSAQVNTLKRSDVKAILLSAGSPQTASVASVSASVGLDVPIVGNAPIFTPDLLQNPAGAAIEKNVYVATALAPPALEDERVKEFLSAWQEEHPDEQPIQNGSMLGYAGAQIMHEVLDTACENDALNRDGVLEALRSTESYDPGGTVAGTLDYTDPSVPPTRLVYISKVDEKAPGGLTVTGEPFVSDLAESYEFGQ
jgi:ABC-type branched-subunit amino acid transport system substrate-binding protein